MTGQDILLLDRGGCNGHESPGGQDRRPTICQLLLAMDIGGAEVLAARISRVLSDRFRFVFVCLDEKGQLAQELEGEGYECHLLARQEGVDLTCARRLARFVRTQEIDLIHAHQYSPFFYGAASRLFGHRTPILFTEHGREYPDYRRPKRVLFNRLCLRAKDHVVGVGQSVRQQLIDNEGLPAGRVSVIYNGVDVERIVRTACDRADVRREIGVAPDDFVAIQVARLDALKDHATAIRAVTEAVGRVPNFRLVLVGDGPERDSIRDQIEACGVRNHVRMLGLRRDVPKLLKAADMFLLTSVSEGIPLVLIEAMSAGLPIVATDVGGVSEVVSSGRTGTLVPPRDHVALGRAIQELATNEAMRMAVQSRGVVRARADFAEPAMVDSYAHCYDRMATRRNGTRLRG